MKRRIISIIVAVALCLGSLCALGGCGGEEETTGTFPVNVAGITINEQPEVIACLSVGYSEAIVDIGYASMLDGRPGDCELPQLQAAAPCGTSEKPSVDAIINLGTDLLIIDSDTPTEGFEALEAAGVTVLTLIKPTTRTGYLNLYRCLGTAINGNGKGYEDGEAAAQNILTQLDSVERAVMFETPVNVCIFTSSTLASSITGDSLASYLIELAGGFNVCIESVDGFCDLQTVIISDPEVILCPEGCENAVLAQRRLEGCRAIPNDKKTRNRVYAYDLSKFDSYGNDLVLATWELARLFHPEVIAASQLPYGAVDYMPDYSDVISVGDIPAD